MAKIRTEILIESRDQLIVRRKRYSARAFCGECRRMSIMVLPTEAAFLSGHDINLIISLMLESSLHVRRLGKGRAFICLTSLCLLENENQESGGEEEFTATASETKTGSFNFINEENLKNET